MVYKSRDKLCLHVLNNFATVLRFLSLRYSADFRRSRLASADHRPHTDRFTLTETTLTTETKSDQRKLTSPLFQFFSAL